MCENILTVFVPDAPLSSNVSIYDLGVSACHNHPMGIKISADVNDLDCNLLIPVK